MCTLSPIQGVNKHDGEPVAVKTFNQMSHMRPVDVQMREFEVLQKVNHENIVKLLAIEDDQEGRGKVRLRLEPFLYFAGHFHRQHLLRIVTGDCHGTMYRWQPI